MTVRARQIFGWVTIFSVVILALFVIFPIAAGAVEQSNDAFPTVSCGGEWHWVHNQTDATSGTLTATFLKAGVKTAAARVNGAVLHYYIYLDEGDTLLSSPRPADDVDDGRLLLSHWPSCVTPTTVAAQTTTSVAAQTTTSAAAQTTTSAAAQTTTSAAVPGTTPTSTSSVLATSTSQAAAQTTSTTRLEVAGTSMTAPSSTVSGVSETLPVTGLSEGAAGGVAVALIAVGGLVVLAIRRRQPDPMIATGWHERMRTYDLW